MLLEMMKIYSMLNRISKHLNNYKQYYITEYRNNLRETEINKCKFEKIF